MIESFLARNFQPHRRTKIKLDPLVTTVIGRTDKGKSALIRLLRWIALNQPSGHRFIRWGSKFAKGEIVVDGHRIVRKRSKSTNAYYLDGKKLEAFGKSGVPEQIKSILNLDEVNFQNQHDLHFWFSKTPGQVSKELNRIINLEVIDTSLANIAKEVRLASTKVEVSQQRLDEAKAKRHELDWIKDVDKDLRALEAIEAELSSVSSEVLALSRLTLDATEHVKSRRRRRNAQQQLAATCSIASQVLSISTQVESLETLLLEVQRTKQVKQPTSMEHLDTMLEELELSSQEIVLLDSDITEIERLEKVSCERRNQATQLEEELHTKTKGRCPICGSQMTKT